MNLPERLKSFLIREGLVYEMGDNDTVTVLDQYSDTTIGPCKIVRTPGSPKKDLEIGTEVLVLEINYKYYVLGTLIISDVNIVTENGENIWFLGGNRAFVGYADGACGIYNLFTRDDGSYVANPLLAFDDEGNLSIIASDMNISAGNIYSEKTELGDTLFASKESKFRSSAGDVMPRQTKSLKGSPIGISDKKVTSIIQSPANPAILPLDTMEITPLTVVEETSSLMPKKIKYLLAPGVETSVEISLDGSVSIKTPTASVTCSAIGQVTISSTVLGKISISPLGVVSIDGKAGVDIKGATLSLLDVLYDLAVEMSTMTVPTGVGPSGPPLTAMKFAAMAAKLKIIKGGA